MGRTDTNDLRQKDTFRQRKLQAQRVLEDFLARSTDPAFCGSITIELNAKGGQIGRLKHTNAIFEPE